MKKLIAVFLLVCSTFASATTLGENPLGCISEELLDEVTTAIRKNDDQRMKWALKNGCVWMKRDVQFSVIKRFHSIGVSKIRVYIGNESLVMYLHMEDLID